MIILTVRTDRPQAEVGLFEDQKKLAYISWEAHRTLTDTIHVQIKKLLQEANKDWLDIEGVAIFKGPGSFTGLRIGFAVANTLAYAQGSPIVASSGDAWLQDAIQRLLAGEDDHIAIPEYGALANTTKPKK